MGLLLNCRGKIGRIQGRIEHWDNRYSLVQVPVGLSISLSFSEFTPEFFDEQNRYRCRGFQFKHAEEPYMCASHRPIDGHYAARVDGYTTYR